MMHAGICWKCGNSHAPNQTQNQSPAMFWHFFGGGKPSWQS
jgi:hypothetical protein